MASYTIGETATHKTYTSTIASELIFGSGCVPMTTLVRDADPFQRGYPLYAGRKLRASPPMPLSVVAIVLKRHGH